MPQHLTRIVRNRSSRNGAKPKLIVLHTTEGHERPGVQDLQGLASWFDSLAARASSHVGNDAEGNTIRMVPDHEKSWTQATFNPVSLSIEQIGFARESRAEWLKQMPQLTATALQVREWSAKYGIPIRKGRTLGGVVVLSGVVQHSQLGAAGGGHHDCGPGFPFDLVLEMAKGQPTTKLEKWRAELKHRRSQLVKETRKGTRKYLIRRIGELKRAINREKGGKP
jgi:hypothetical protein